MHAVDTNVLVQLVVREDPVQTRSAQAFVDQGVWVSSLALAETIWVLTSTYGFSPNAIEGTLEMFLNHKSVVLQDEDAVRAALDLFRNKPGLGFSDCLLLHLARVRGHIPFGTFDRKLARVDGAQKL